MNIDQITNPSPVIRMAVLKAIADGMCSCEAEHVLSQTLQFDTNAVVRHEAAFILSSLMDDGLIDGGEALAALHCATHDSSVLVRHEAALSLASFPSHESTLALERLANDPSEDVRVSANFALETMR